MAVIICIHVQVSYRMFSYVSNKTWMEYPLLNFLRTQCVSQAAQTLVFAADPFSSVLNVNVILYFWINFGSWQTGKSHFTDMNLFFLNDRKHLNTFYPLLKRYKRNWCHSSVIPLLRCTLRPSWVSMYKCHTVFYFIRNKNWMEHS